MNGNLNRVTGTLGVCLVVGSLLGCATPASQVAMQPASSELSATVRSADHLRGKVAVRNVTGGKETNPMWTSQVDAASFKQALQDSMSSVGYLSADPQKATYVVDADLKALNQPLFGFTFDVESTVQYTVEKAGVGKDLSVKAVGSATVSDAFLGVERLRVANERSIKENIKSFLGKLVLLTKD